MFHILTQTDMYLCPRWASNTADLAKTILYLGNARTHSMFTTREKVFRISVKYNFPIQIGCIAHPPESTLHLSISTQLSYSKYKRGTKSNGEHVLFQVIWFKETMQLDTTERHIMESRGSRHTLIIRKVHPQDFGNYSCVAENPLGKARKIVQLTGKPNTAIFRSAAVSQYKDRYLYSYTTSYSLTCVRDF